MKLLLPLILIILLVKNISSSRLVETFPGFPGRLPFKMETGYVGVGENEEVQMFYYFVESGRDPVNDPLVIWLTGGPGCSGVSSFVYEIGPVRMSPDLPTPFLELASYPWSKIVNIIFLDTPVGAGFSYSTTQKGYPTSDSKATKNNYEFLQNWLLSHPRFINNPLFVAGVSYGGKMATMLALEIAQGIEDGSEPKMSFQGYLIGNGFTDVDRDGNERIPYAHRMGLISDEYYENAKVHCKGQYVNTNPDDALCNHALDVIQTCLKGIRAQHILYPKCNADPNQLPLRLRIDDGDDDEKYCRDELFNVLLDNWMSNATVQESLHVRKGTVTEWHRCNSTISYDQDVPSVFEYYKLINKKGYDILFYSGDQDLVVSTAATLKTVRALNFSIHESWRPWIVNGQIAGYTQKYKNNGAYITFSTVKGAGHTPSQYKPRRVLEMLRRFTSKIPL